MGNHLDSNWPHFAKTRGVRIVSSGSFGRSPHERMIYQI